MASPSDEDLENLSGGDDLFGDEEQDQSDQERQLSDRELDSGDDEGHNDEDTGTMDGTEQQVDINDRVARIMDASIPRQPLPRPSDGELNLLRIPKFLGVDPLPYDALNFKLPVTDHHSTNQSTNFSANATAISTIRFQKSADTGKLESNATFNRWSDGSATISVGENIYELTTKSLAPPKSKNLNTYQDAQDSHQYVAAPYIASQLMQIVGHMTNQYDLRPNKEIEDVALEKLQSSLAALTRGRNKNDIKDGIALISSTQDPELQKRQAEMAEKERMKAQRRRETAAARADQQTTRIRTAIGGGLSLDDLEGRSRIPGSRKKRPAPAGRRRAPRRADYDSDDDDLPRGRGREDEYDLEDDFLAPSDDELEGDGGDESEEEEEESEREESPKTKRQKVTKDSKLKQTSVSAVDSDIDAEGEDEDVGLPTQLVPSAGGDLTGGRGRKRNIIVDDEDDE